MSEQRQGVGGRGLRAVIGLGFLTMGSGVFGRDTLAARTEADPSPTITILLYNYAQTSAGTLTRAEREASRILREAGVETVWQDCPTGPLRRWPARTLPGAAGICRGRVEDTSQRHEEWVPGHRVRLCQSPGIRECLLRPGGAPR